MTLYNCYQNTVVIKIPSVYMYRIEEIGKFYAFGKFEYYFEEKKQRRKYGEKACCD